MMDDLKADKRLLAHTKDTLISLATITGDRRYLNMEEKAKGEMAMCEMADELECRGMERGVEQGEVWYVRTAGRRGSGEVLKIIIRKSIIKVLDASIYLCYDKRVEERRVSTLTLAQMSD